MSEDNKGKLELDPLSFDEQLLVDKTFRDTWQECVMNPNGTINMEAVKRELYDFCTACRCAGQVYKHVTGCKTVTLLTEPEVVCSLADNHYQQDMIDKSDVRAILHNIENAVLVGNGVMEAVRRARHEFELEV